MSIIMPPAPSKAQFERLRTAASLVLPVARTDAGQGYLSSGSFVKHSYRVPYRAMTSFANFQAVFANRQITNTAPGYANGPNDWTVKAALEMPDGTLIPMYFGGVREPNVAAGSSVISDALPVRINAGELFFIRAMPTVVTVGQKWPTGFDGVKGTAAGGGYASNTDVVDTVGSAAYSLVARAFQASHVLGTPLSNVVAGAVLIGSSGAEGYNDTSDSDLNYGYLARALASQSIPLTRLALTASTLLQYTGATPTLTASLANLVYHQWAIARARPSVILNQMGSNDWIGVGSLAAMQARLNVWWTALAGFGLPVVQLTYTPRVAGTFTTLVGQTADPADSIRQATNDWIKTHPHPAITAVWDVAALAQAPTDATIWRVDGGAWTDDGTHMSIYGTSQLWPLVAPLAATLRS